MAVGAPVTEKEDEMLSENIGTSTWVMIMSGIPRLGDVCSSFPLNSLKKFRMEFEVEDGVRPWLRAAESIMLRLSWSDSCA